jgi:hypothetical protein
MSTSTKHVGRILHFGSNVQMGRVAARRIVASMKCTTSSGISTHGDKRNSRRLDRTPPYVELPIPVVVE